MRENNIIGNMFLHNKKQEETNWTSENTETGKGVNGPLVLSHKMGELPFSNSCTKNGIRAS